MRAAYVPPARGYPMGIPSAGCPKTGGAEIPGQVRDLGKLRAALRKGKDFKREGKGGDFGCGRKYGTPVLFNLLRG